ncbi:MAG: hypothetical protein ABIB65_01970 [Candidatus Margulisiibacteriota bacterium]
MFKKIGLVSCLLMFGLAAASFAGSFEQIDRVTGFFVSQMPGPGGSPEVVTTNIVPDDMIIDRAGNGYASFLSHVNKVNKYNASTRDLVWSQTLNSPSDLSFDNSGGLWVRSSDGINKINASNGSIVEAYGYDAVGGSRGVRFACDPTNNYFYSFDDVQNVLKSYTYSNGFSENAAFTLTATPGAQAIYGPIINFAVMNSLVVVLNPDGLNFITTGAAFTGPVRYAGSFMGLALDGRGNVFTYDRIARKLLKLNYTIGQVRVVSELPFSDGISAIAIGRQQTLVCAASGASTIDLVTFRQTQ